jgi:hypothetical protein
MSTFKLSALWASAWIALAAFSSNPALAELPEHPLAQGLGPAPSDSPQIPGEPPAPMQFGAAVAIRNGLAFAGMPGEANGGRVGVYSLATNGWVRTAALVGSDLAPGAEFGRAVTFRDGIAVVGSRTAAYVFKRVSGVWKQIQKLVPPAVDPVSTFAVAIRYEAGTLAIGGRASGTASDAVYIFEIDSTTGKFVRRASLRAADGFHGDRFGDDISMTSTTIVIGAPGNGAAYVFRRNSAGRWVQRQKLVAVEAQRALGFGEAVAIDNGMIIVGAPGTDPEGGENGPPTQDGHVAQGAAYGFLPVNGQYLESFKLRPRPDEFFTYEKFGAAIAMFGSRIVVSASSNGILGCEGPEGFVFSFARDGASVLTSGIATEAIKDPVTLALANNWLLVGSPFDGCTQEGFIGSGALFNLNRLEP